MLVGFGLNTSLSSAFLVLNGADRYGLEKQMSFHEIFGLGFLCDSFLAELVSV